MKRALALAAVLAAMALTGCAKDEKPTGSAGDAPTVRPARAGLGAGDAVGMQMHECGAAGADLATLPQE